MDVIASSHSPILLHGWTLELANLAGFLLGGALLDIGVWHSVKGLQIYDNEDVTGSARKKRDKRRREGQEMTTQLNQPAEHPVY
jgi:hypothetical protein